MAKIFRYLKLFKMSYRHAEHHAKTRSSLGGLDQETLFFLTDPLIFKESQVLSKDEIVYQVSQEGRHY